MKYLSKFSVERYLSSVKTKETAKGAEVMERYLDVLEFVKHSLNKEWERAGDDEKAVRLRLEKDAIIGKLDAANFFKDKISQILSANKLLAEPYPEYYPGLVSALFADIYGLAGVAPWAYNMFEKYRNSSSAKIIGDKLYCLIDGKSVLQPQRLSQQRRNQLTSALLLDSPKERKEDSFHEVYLQNGIRVTIFSGETTKPGLDCIVFRKYLLTDLSFEMLASYGTFPAEAIPLFKAMCEIGFNVVFAGQMRSGKTTFLQTWQSYEDKTLEGVTIATDPETRWDLICKDAPIMQLIATEDTLAGLESSIKRSDADYVILEEMRDAASYNLFLAITSLGTQRSKGTVHDNSAINIPYKMATAIHSEMGGDEDAIISQVYSNVNYVIELYQVPENRSRKRLKGITEFRYDAASDTVSANQICRYNPSDDTWQWKCDIGKDKEQIATGYEAPFSVFKETLKALEEASPLTGESVIYPAYYKGNRNIERKGVSLL